MINNLIMIKNLKNYNDSKKYKLARLYASIRLHSHHSRIYSSYTRAEGGGNVARGLDPKSIYINAAGSFDLRCRGTEEAATGGLSI